MKEEVSGMQLPTGEQDLSGHNSVVTGGANGLGRAIGTALARAGSTVFLLDRDATHLEEARDQIVAETGRTVHVFDDDLSGCAGLRRAFDAVGGAFDRLDVLVNNVGGSFGTPVDFGAVTEQDFDSVLHVNVKSAFFATQYALPLLTAAGRSSVVNLTSICGRAGLATNSAQYSLSKAAIVGLTQNLAKQLGAKGVRVNAIAPGYISSGPRVDEIWNSRDSSPILAAIPLGRRGESDEIASVAAFLAGTGSSYISGATIDVNGAFLAV